MFVSDKTLQHAAGLLGERLKYKPTIVSIENEETKKIERFYMIQPHANGKYWPIPTIEREQSFRNLYTEMTKSSQQETTDEPRFIGLNHELEWPQVPLGIKIYNLINNNI